MKRRDFIKATALSAVAISASGSIRFDGKQYIGDCETTSDILGPFYRPNSPVRNNLRINGQPGELAELSGYVRHNDCITPYPKAKVELWHCDTLGVYDNESSEFRFRGTTFTDEKGFYSFQTIFPVAYGGKTSDGKEFIRPAHFHLVISADGYQPLVTQLYFNGDKHIKGDVYASSPTAKRRILPIEKDNRGMVVVKYDVGMSSVLHLEVASMDKLVGKYVEQKDKKVMLHFFGYENSLWLKNEAFGEKFEYVGNNTFEEANTPAGTYSRLVFTLQPSGSIELKWSYIDIDFSKKEFTYLKDK